jgi:hypothetical protein
MRKVFPVLIALALAPLFLGGRANAQDAAALTRQHFEAGTLDEGERLLAARLGANAGDDQARFGLGMIRFGRALETFARHQYRYGLRAAGDNLFPFLRMPVPYNPEAEKLTYPAQRAALQRLIDDFAQVESTLAPAGAGEAKITLDLENIRFNVTGASPDQALPLMAMLRSTAGAPRGGRLNPAAPNAPAAPFEVTFDRADLVWLRGYCRLLSAMLEFSLAYDWSETFANSAAMFYPNLRADGFVDESGFDGMTGDRGSSGFYADVVAMIHGVRWPVAEAARLRSVRENLKQVIQLSRENWRLILAETDDEREWVPAPKQTTGVFTTMEVTQERVDAWHGALDDFEAVLDGRKLLPHWRTQKGINLRRVFEEPRPFDFVLWITGHAAAPYLENGPVMTRQSWAVWEQVFQGNFLMFAIYFN